MTARDAFEDARRAGWTPVGATQASSNVSTGPYSGFSISHGKRGPTRQSPISWIVWFGHWAPVREFLAVCPSMNYRVSSGVPTPAASRRALRRARRPPT